MTALTILSKIINILDETHKENNNLPAAGLGLIFKDCIARLIDSIFSIVN